MNEEQMSFLDEAVPTTGREYDSGASRVARDESIERVERNAEQEFLDAAYEAVCEAARLFPDGFNTDDVWKCLPEGIDYPHEPRAMGPVMLRAKRDGIIVPTGEFRASAKVVSHAGPRRIWKAA